LGFVYSTQLRGGRNLILSRCFGAELKDHFREFGGLGPKPGERGGRGKKFWGARIWSQVKPRGKKFFWPLALKAPDK